MGSGGSTKGGNQTGNRLVRTLTMASEKSEFMSGMPKG